MASIEQRHFLLSKAKRDKGLQRELVQLCKLDIVFWFNHFCWTFDPRLKQPHQPFNLYPVQKQIARQMVFCIEEGKEGRDGNILFDKSRDMGATWEVLEVYQWYWQFEEGSDFHLGSKKLEDVDKKGVRSSLFQKLRYNIAYQPAWMLPKLGRHDDSECKLINPVNGNAITGQAATMDFGRSGRYKSMLADEFARHPYGQAAYESAANCTNSILLLFTPYGKGNHAYKLASDNSLIWVPLSHEDTPEEEERTIVIFKGNTLQLAA